MDWTHVLKSTMILFAVVNPVGSIPIFLQLTSSMDRSQRFKAFGTAILASIAILVTFVVAGEGILTHFFQIQVTDLMAAGGLLLLIIAIDHLVFGSLVKGVLTAEQQDPHHIGAVPIACPILAGPGAMMTVLVIASEHGYTAAAISITAVLGVSALILFFIDTIYRILGRIVCTVLSKILCLFLAAIGIRLLVQGLVPYFK